MAVLIRASAVVMAVACVLLLVGHLAVGIELRRERLEEEARLLIARAGPELATGDAQRLRDLLAPLGELEGFVGAAVCGSATRDGAPECGAAVGRLATDGATPSVGVSGLVRGRVTVAAAIGPAGEPSGRELVLESDWSGIGWWLVAGFVVVGGAVVCWVLVTWWVGRWIQKRFVDPIVELARRAGEITRQRVSGEQPDARDRWSTGELGVLEHSFDRMLEALGTRSDEIEGRRDLLEKVVEMSPAGIVVVEEGGRIALASGAAREALELQAAPGGGWSLPAGSWVATAPAGTSGGSPLDLLAGAGAAVVRGRWVYEGPSGRRRGLLVDGRPWSGEGGARGAILALSEIDREYQLMEQLIESQKLEAVGRLAEAAAHDFNNVLTAILGYTEVLRGQVEGQPRAEESVAGIVAAAQRAAGLAGELLTFGQRQESTTETVEVDRHLAIAEQMLRRIAGETVQIEATFGSPGRLVRVDAARLDQVVMNLVINAREAMPQGGLIEITTEGVDGGAGEAAPGSVGQWVKISVRDHGRGMTPEDRARAFEPFFTTREGGTGLGLSTAYGVVRNAGGTIRVESEPDRGTLFEILLPALASGEGGDGEGRRAAVGGAAGAGRRMPTVLLAEDDAGVRSLVCRMLDKSSYRVLAAANGVEALAMSDEFEGEIDLLISDIVMPELRGPELRRRLEEKRFGMPAIFISGYADAELWREAFGDGRTAFLQKPFRPGDLAEKMEEILVSSGGQATSERHGGASGGQPREA